MEIHQIFITCLVLVSTVSLSEGQRYQYDKNKLRPNATILDGKPWVGPSEPRPPNFPGTKLILVSEHGKPCKRDRILRQYRHTDTKKNMFYYPWEVYVKNCDIFRFLWCSDDTNVCTCFPGFYWKPYPADKNATQGAGRCVAGFQQNCSVFKAYDFWATPECGDNMQCDNSTNTCVCHKNVLSLRFQGENIKDGAPGPKNTKLFCDSPKRLKPPEDCHEYMGYEWRKIPPDNMWKKYPVPKTDCGDVGNGEKNMYCKFPASLTGPAKSGTTTIEYGNRKGGKCSCTDPKLRYRDRVGCVPRPGVRCVNGKVTYLGRRPLASASKPFQIVTGDCGPNAMCSKIKGPGRCMCMAGAQVVKRTLLCEKELYPNDTVLGQSGSRIGKICDVQKDCDVAGGQVCDGTICVCGPGWETDTENNICKGLYGVPCKDDKSCVNDHFECVEVPELARIHDKIDKEQKYCVCKEEYLHELSGKCGASAIKAVSSCLLLLVIFIADNLRSTW